MACCGRRANIYGQTPKTINMAKKTSQPKTATQSGSKLSAASQKAYEEGAKIREKLTGGAKQDSSTTETTTIQQ